MDGERLVLSGFEAGAEFLAHGNDEDFNLHLRTADCQWYDESYRTAFLAVPRWQRL